MRTRSVTSLAAAAVVGAALVAPAPGQALYDVEVFEPLANHPSTFAAAMSERGVVIGSAGEDRYDPRVVPIAIHRGRVIEGPKPNESLNFVLGIGRADLVVGTSSTFPYVWKRGVPQRLRAVGGIPQGSATDANTRDVICGEVVRDYSGAQYPVIWPNSDARGLMLPALGSARRGAAFAINENNQVAGAIHDVPGYDFVAVRWDSLNAPPRPLGVLPGAMNSEGLCINNHGDVAGRSSFPDFSIKAFIYLEDLRSMVALGDLGGGYSFAHGINDLRQVVGESTVPTREVHGFVWQDGLMRDLNDHIRNSNRPYLYISNAVAIDSTGRIAAEVQVNEGFGTATRIALLTPVP